MIESYCVHLLEVVVDVACALGLLERLRCRMRKMFTLLDSVTRFCG